MTNPWMSAAYPLCAPGLGVVCFFFFFGIVGYSGLFCKIRLDKKKKELNSQCGAVESTTSAHLDPVLSLIGFLLRR